MKGVLAATAVIGVLAIGGLPALALTLADAETAGRSASAAEGSDRRADHAERRPGPPAWAHDKGPGRESGRQRWKEAKRDQREAWQDAGRDRKQAWKDAKRDQKQAWKDRRGDHDGPPPWAGGPHADR